MERNCLHNGFCNECVLLIDYKMKFEPVYFREKTVDHYGKRGISWHGSMITFYTCVCVDGVQTTVPNKFYMDHVVENESKQDVTSVISILEAMIIAIKKLFPHITTIFLQSDNASCYQNTVLLMLIPYLGCAHSLYIRRFIHTETQDGKSVLDAHFARSTQVVYEHCKAVSKLEDNFAECDRKLKKIIKRTNEVLFSYADSTSTNDISTSSYQGNYMPPFSLQGYEYSGKGNPRTVVIDPTANTVTTQDDVTHSNDFEELDSEDSELDDELETVANYLIQGEHLKDHESSTSSEESDGWARRPKNGQMYGPKHVLIYRSDILEMFKLVKYPQEFCLPLENDIRVEINRLQTKKKSPNVASKGEKVIDIYDAFIREIAAKNVSLKPKDALTMTLQQFPRKENPHLPSDSKIRSKFSYQELCAKERNQHIK
ncbi:hypothetical protein GHT06_011445 [Daphnia sinensis]|uniref:Uncharacterized protein n=1 Tax=Daphnia sinensis TaxID=1820382 RepID=A0AAD5KWN9_9CRUS|nr:hypothetical protein GHT06_011445 [Daphnia sinensis]